MFFDGTADKATENDIEIVRVPSGASAKSKWSVVKSSASLASAVKTNHLKVAGNGANTEFRRVPSNASQQQSLGTNKQFKRVPSNASQQKSVKSHWSDLKSRVSHGRCVPACPLASAISYLLTYTSALFENVYLRRSRMRVQACRCRAWCCNFQCSPTQPSRAKTKRKNVKLGLYRRIFRRQETWARRGDARGWQGV